jgi:hypothetical protein
MTCDFALKDCRLRRQGGRTVNLGGGAAVGMIGESVGWSVEGAGLVDTGASSYRGFRFPTYRRFRFPTEIISHCVWLYVGDPAFVPVVRDSAG